MDVPLPHPKRERADSPEGMYGCFSSGNLWPQFQFGKFESVNIRIGDNLNL